MRRRTLCPFILLLLAATLAANAFVQLTHTESVLLQKGLVSDGVSWESHSQLTDSGLHYVDPNSQTGLWLQTGNIPIGGSSRPPSNGDFNLSLKGDMPSKGYDIQAYLRYGCDGKHWSTWFFMEPQDKAADGAFKTYKCRIRVPMSACERYDALKQEWWKTNPEDRYDEFDLCTWIAKKDPSFFDTELPFVGYVQIRLESQAPEVTLNELSLQETFSITGGYSSQRKNTHKNGGKWHFE